MNARCRMKIALIIIGYQMLTLNRLANQWIAIGRMLSAQAIAAVAVIVIEPMVVVVVVV